MNKLTKQIIKKILLIFIVISILIIILELYNYYFLKIIEGKCCKGLKNIGKAITKTTNQLVKDGGIEDAVNKVIKVSGVVGLINKAIKITGVKGVVNDVLKKLKELITLKAIQKFITNVKKGITDMNTSMNKSMNKSMKK